MPQLLFKRQFIDSIRRGTKTSTLRRWKYARLHPGTRASVPGVGWLRILSCRRVEQKDLTSADATADGFKSLKELLDTLRELYPRQDDDGRHWYRVAFEREDAPSTPSPVSQVPNKAPDKAPEKPTPAVSRKKTARKRLARRIRADLDKAVRQSGSLFPL
ncbi:MAG: ASCH domain-containing protein [Tepidisphaeraceae bacterium]